MKKIIAVLCVCLMFAGCTAATDISYATIEKSGYFVVGYNPENFHTNDGYGLAVDIIKTAAQRMGLEAPIYPVNGYDWQTHLGNNKIDIMLCAKSEENLVTIDLFYDEIVFIRVPGEIKKIGVMDTELCIEQKNKMSAENDYQYLYYSNPNLLLNDLEHSIIDGGILSEYDMFSGNNISLADYTISPLIQLPVTFVVSKNSTTFYENINTVLKQMVNDGTIGRMKREYLDSLK